MNIKKFYTVLIILLPALLMPLTAQEAEKLKFTTVMADAGVNPDPFLNKISLTIEKQLKKEKFFIINNQLNLTEKIDYKNCLKNHYFEAQTGIPPEGIVVIISLTAEEVKTGEKEISRYAYEDITETRYALNVATAQLRNEKYDLVFIKTFSDQSKLISRADIIGKKIREFYIKAKQDVTLKDESQKTLQ